MDPDATLDLIKDLARKVVYEADNSPEVVGELAANFMELDLWLQKGGFLPRRWRR